MTSENKKQRFDFFIAAPTANIQAAIPNTQRFIDINNNIVCAISGGADSDIMLDMVCKLDVEKKVTYVFYNTGLEMDVTLEHLSYLEQKYKIIITRVLPTTTTASACKKYGQPFLSKTISEYIDRLQRNGFQWEIAPVDELLKKYPRCRSAIRWWCNDFGKGSRFNIERNLFLKEFLHSNPPHQISKKCCDYGKKQPAYDFAKKIEADISFLGIRKAEGGARSTAYKTCFIDGKHGPLHFPLFWFTDEDKTEYEKAFEIIHSKAYTEYGCKRTGCVACPFGSGFEDELKMLQEYEPKKHTAAMAIFGDSIEYSRKYRIFKEHKKHELTIIKTEAIGQMCFDEIKTCT